MSVEGFAFGWRGGGSGWRWWGWSEGLRRLRIGREGEYAAIVC